MLHAKIDSIERGAPCYRTKAMPQLITLGFNTFLRGNPTAPSFTEQMKRAHEEQSWQHSRYIAEVFWSWLPRHNVQLLCIWMELSTWRPSLTVKNDQTQLEGAPSRECAEWTIEPRENTNNVHNELEVDKRGRAKWTWGRQERTCKMN